LPKEDWVGKAVKEGAMLGFGDRPEEEVGLVLGSSLSFNIQLGLRLLWFVVLPVVVVIGNGM